MTTNPLIRKPPPPDANWVYGWFNDLPPTRRKRVKDGLWVRVYGEPWRFKRDA